MKENEGHLRQQWDEMVRMLAHGFLEVVIGVAIVPVAIFLCCYDIKNVLANVMMSKMTEMYFRHIPHGKHVENLITSYAVFVLALKYKR